MIFEVCALAVTNSDDERVALGTLDDNLLREVDDR